MLLKLPTGTNTSRGQKNEFRQTFQQIGENDYISNTAEGQSDNFF